MSDELESLVEFRFQHNAYEPNFLGLPNMALDDLFVWVIIGSLVIFLFGANKLPGLARGLGHARREFENASKGITTTNAVAHSPDPLIEAAEKEGIDTAGKTREQIASELSWKLNKK